MGEYRINNMMSFYISTLQFSFSITWNETCGGHETPQISHSTHEIYVVTKGYCNLRIFDEEYLLKEGMFAVIPKNEKHSLYNLSDDFTRVTIGPILFKQKYLRIEKEMSNKAKEKCVFDITPNMHHCLSFIKNCTENEYDGYINASESIITAMFFEMFNILDINLSSEQKNQHIEDNQKIKEILSFIRKNAATKITTKDVANHMNLSVRQLSRIMLKNKGYTVKESINGSKLQIARELLKHTDDTISEIAYKLGFSSEQSFIVFFKKEANITPNQYRKNPMY